MSDKVNEDITLERIKELKGNDSQEAFAQKISSTQSNVSKMLNGTPPSAATLKTLATVYKVSVDWLLGLTDKKEIGDKVLSHDLTAETITYADAMAVLEVLYQKQSVDVGFDMNGYNNDPDPDMILVKDKVLAYFLDNRFRYSEGSRDIYEIWLKKAMQNYDKNLLLQWDETTSAIYQQNEPKQPSDSAIIKLVDDIENGKAPYNPEMDDSMPFN